MRHTDDCSAGLKAQPPGYRFETADYDIFQVIAVCSGELHLCSDELHPCSGERRVLEAGDVLVLRRGGRFVLSSPVTGYNGVSFYSYRDPEPGFIGPPAVVRATRTMEELVALMLHEASFPGPTALDLLGSLGLALAHAALGEIARKVSSPADSVAEALRLSIRASLQSGATIRELCHAAGLCGPAGLSYRQVQRRFRAVHRVTPKAYQVAARIRESQRLLSATSLPVTTIAMELGFPSSQHFAAVFRRHVGESPREYRRRAG